MIDVPAIIVAVIFAAEFIFLFNCGRMTLPQEETRAP